MTYWKLWKKTPSLKKISWVKHLLLTSYAFTANTRDGKVVNFAMSNASMEWYVFILPCRNQFSNLTYFQSVFSLTNHRSEFPLSLIKVKNVQIIYRHFWSKWSISHLGKRYVCTFNKVRNIYIFVADLPRFTNARFFRMI